MLMQTQVKMSLQEFSGYVAENIRNYMPPEYGGADVTVRKVYKDNDTELVAVDVKRSGETVVPSVYLNDLYDRYIGGEDPARCAKFMKALSKNGSYTITEEMREGLSDFISGYADEEETAREIRTVYENDGYVIDPHTAVASSVYRRYLRETGDATPAVIDSTASPFKFEGSVMKALGKDTSLPDLELADRLSETAGVPVPKAVSDLRDAPVLHDIVCDRKAMKKEVKKFLGL